MNEDVTCRIIGQMDNTIDHTFEIANRVYDKEGLCPTIPTCGGGNIQPKILVKQRTLKAKITEKGIRIYQDDEKQSTASEFGTIQKTDTVCNAIIASNPNYIINRYRIRKLTPLECFRLMAVSDYDAAKMLAVNSNSQCYKQAGNSIVVDVMCAMFRNLNIKGVTRWENI